MHTCASPSGQTAAHSLFVRLNTEPGNAHRGGRGGIEISLFIEWHQGTEKQIQMLRHKLSPGCFGHLVTGPEQGQQQQQRWDLPQTSWAVRWALLSTAEPSTRATASAECFHSLDIDIECFQIFIYKDIYISKLQCFLMFKMSAHI